ncbi:MAG: CoA-binding protein [Candidatus Nanopelagicales bacterium]
MTSLYGDADDITRVLDDASLWFVVGLGNNPERVAFEVSAALQGRGKRIVPIYPRAEVVHGEQGYATIAEAVTAVGVPDVVDVFVRSHRAGEFADEAIAAGAGAVWFQLGVVDEAAAQRVVDAGVTMIMDTCPLIEWRRRGN